MRTKDIFTLRALGFAAFAVLALATFTACSSDDDDEGGGGDGAAAALDNNPAYTYKKVGTATFAYDDNNRCVKVEAYNHFYMDYENGKLSHDLNYDRDAYDAKYNSNGYLISLSGGFDERQYEDYGKGDDWRAESERYTLSYNNAGNLTRVSYSSRSQGYYKYDNESYDYGSSFELNLTWKDGNLVRAAYNGDDEGDKFSYTYSISYSNLPNITGRYTGVFEDCKATPFRHLDLSALCLGGVLGKGPAFLPSTLEATGVETYYDEGEVDKEEFEAMADATYSLDEFGRVSHEQWTGKVKKDGSSSFNKDSKSLSYSYCLYNVATNK